jgi:dinuclear metal center YbgI/SA1388 family protein
MKQINASQLYSYLNDLFPQSSAAEWDKVGFQIPEVFGTPQQDKLQNVVICLDVTSEVVEYAIEKKSNLIISRHPFIFNEIDLEKKDESKKTNYQKLVANGIQVFSIHTNYDASDKQSLLNLIEYKLNVKAAKKLEAAHEIFDIKLLNEITNKQLIDDLKFIFGIKYVKFNANLSLEDNVSRFYICPGAGSSLMKEHGLKNCTYVTGEAKWSDFIYAKENGINLIIVGHYMENYFIDDIQTKITKTFGEELDCFSFDIKNMWMIF